MTANNNKRNLFEEGKKAKDQQNLEEAFLLFSEAIAAEPKNSKGFQKRGDVFMAMHEHAKALYDFSYAISLLLAEKEKDLDLSATNPKNKIIAENYFLAGSCHFELG